MNAGCVEVEELFERFAAIEQIIMSKDLLPSPGTMEAGDGLNDQPRAQSEAEFGVRVDSRANPATDCLHHGPASKVTNPARQPAMFGAFGGDVYSRRHLIRRSSVHVCFLVISMESHAFCLYLNSVEKCPTLIPRLVISNMGSFHNLT